MSSSKIKSSLPSKNSAALRLLRDLRGAEALASRLKENSPDICSRHGGAHAIVARYGYITSIGFWLLNLSGDVGEELWEELARENEKRNEQLSP